MSAFATALRGRSTLSVIAEFKRRSPSRGVIDMEVAIEDRVRRYARDGAAALSVLTEAERFSGSLGDLTAARDAVDLPILMKDFIADATHLEAGAAAGASAALLIARHLEPLQLRELAAACHALGLTALVECTDEAEIERALGIDHAAIGINNRDLATLAVDRGRALRLLPRIPADRIAIAESGYLEPLQLEPIVGLADAVLIGTALMTGGRTADFAGVCR